MLVYLLRLQKMQYELFVYCLTSVNGCYSMLDESKLTSGRSYWLVVKLVGGVQGCVLEELKHGILFIRMLFRNEFTVTMENLYIHLLIWK